MLGAFSLRDLAFIAQGRTIIDIIISSAVQNYNLWTVVSANSSYSAGNTRVNVTVNANVGSTSASTDAFAIPAQFGAGDEIFITNSATIITKGGNGGNGANAIQWTGATSGETISSGAINASRPVSITNNGTISGGGGGGGCGGSGGSPRRGGDGGGGGAGFTAGSAGIGGPPGPFAPGFPTNPGTPGQNGTLTTGGAGGPIGGGAGGGQGNDGTTGTGPPSFPFSASGGGTRGFYALGNPNITWVATGTRLGRVQ